MTRTLAVLLLITSHFAYGDCSKDLIVNYSAQLGHEIVSDNLEHRDLSSGETGPKDDHIFYACKVLPNTENLSVIALATVNEARTKAYHLRADGGAIYDLVTAVVDIKTDKQIAKHISSGALESNAVALRGITIDTGHYYLKDGADVFGIRSELAANSHAYVYNSKTLFLYKLQQSSLALILRGLIVEMSSGNTDNNEDNIEENCEKNVIQHSKSILRVLPHVTNDMHDLEIVEKNSDEMSSCEIFRSTLGRKVKLRFDGREYPIPKS